MSSDSTALGSFPFKLQMDCLRCLNIAGAWLLPDYFGGDIGQVSFCCKVTEDQLDSVKQTVNSLVHVSEESRGRTGFKYTWIQELKQYFGINFSNSWFCSPPGGAIWWLPGAPLVKRWVDASRHNKTRVIRNSMSVGPGVLPSLLTYTHHFAYFVLLVLQGDSLSQSLGPLMPQLPAPPSQLPGSRLVSLPELKQKPHLFLFTKPYESSLPAQREADNPQVIGGVYLTVRPCTQWMMEVVRVLAPPTSSLNAFCWKW